MIVVLSAQLTLGFRQKMIGFIFFIRYKNKSWKIVRRRNTFEDLHKKIKSDLKKDGNTLSASLPEFKDSKKEGDYAREQSLIAFTAYLNELASDPNVWNNQTFLEFCEVSRATFTLQGCIIYKEGFADKLSGGRYMEEEKFGSTITNMCRTWSKRWFVITDQYLLFYTDSLDEEPNEVMLIDSNFHVVYGENQTGYDLGMTVINNRRKLEM
jgi:hypothetical protein